MTLILSNSELAKLADMKSTIDAVEAALGDVALGTAHQPAPVSLHLDSSDARFVPMTALAEGPALAAVKMLADIPSNAEKGLPSQRSAIMLTSSVTGETLAILDGKVPTRIRTAAASAVATKHLARKDSKVLGLVGAGALAIAHVEAILHVLPIEEIVVWSRSTKTAEEFRQQVVHHGLPVTIVGNIADVFAEADVVCTLTPSAEPLVKGEWFRPGQHINAVGARPRPTEREIDSAGMQRSRVVVDSMSTTQEKSGEVLLAIDEGNFSLSDIVAELGEVITGQKEGRQTAQDITLFNSVGIGVLDLAIGRLLIDSAAEQGLGLNVNLSA